MTKVVTHLLDERDDTQSYEFSGGMMWWEATWFPFEASVTKYSTHAPFVWELKLQGASGSIRIGEEKTWSAAFQEVADAKKAALKALVEQLAEVPL